MKKLVLGLISTAVIVLPVHAYSLVMPVSNYVPKQVNTPALEKALVAKPLNAMPIQLDGAVSENNVIPVAKATELQPMVDGQQKNEQVKLKENKIQPSLQLSDLQGRYALDCSKEQAHNLSYVISNTQITRLISAKKKQGVAQELKTKAVKHQDYQYLSTALYQGFKVDFYQKDGKHFAKVKSRSISNFYGPKTKELLQQCSSAKP